MIDRCTIKELEIYAIIARKIWLKRNTVVYGWDFSHPNVLIQECASSLNKYRDANDKDNVFMQRKAPVAPEKWNAPPPSIYKLNWNEAIDSTNRHVDWYHCTRQYWSSGSSTKSDHSCYT